MSEKTTVTVTIDGEEYTLRAGRTPEYTRECAEYLDHTLSNVLSHGVPVEQQKAYVLAALSITDELFQAREALEALRAAIASAAGDLAAEVDAVVQRGGQDVKPTGAAADPGPSDAVDA
jgi:cell division protein ZapA (FtsZ GTPase activity inhibitor)